MTTIPIDIGHVRGSGSRGGDFEEHAMCEILGDLLHKQLVDLGIDAPVIDFPDMTNTADLNATVKALNNMTYDFGISLHMDASDNKNARGAHVCYYSATGKKIATAIADELIQLLPGRADKVVQRTGLAVLRDTKRPHVLIECGFITNVNDRSIVLSCMNAIAAKIVSGIKKYIGIK